MVDPKTKGQGEVSGGEGTRCGRNQQATHLTMQFTTSLFWVSKAAEKGAKAPARNHNTSNQQGLDANPAVPLRKQLLPAPSPPTGLRSQGEVGEMLV